MIEYEPYDGHTGIYKYNPLVIIGLERYRKESLKKDWERINEQKAKTWQNKGSHC